jgi:hypothetical protein
MVVSTTVTFPCNANSFQFRPDNATVSTDSRKAKLHLRSVLILHRTLRGDFVIGFLRRAGNNLDSVPDTMNTIESWPLSG